MPPLSPASIRFLAAFAARPKSELHLHLEGAVFPSTLIHLAGRDPKGPFRNSQQVRSRLVFRDFRDFLLLYRDLCRQIRSPSDYALLAGDLVRRLRREAITYAEVYVSPALVDRIGLSWPEVVDALEPVFVRHESAGRGTIRVLLDSVRQWGPGAAHHVLDLHEARPWARVVGFGVGGDEGSVAAREFSEVYERARSLALGTVIHAGEWAGPDSVREALDSLRPGRIAHGIRAAEDPALIRRLVKERVPLDVCLTSNAKTGAVAPRAGGLTHPVLILLRAGVRITLSTDDPGLFSTSLGGEYRRLAHLGASSRELARVARESRSAAFEKTLTLC